MNRREMSTGPRHGGGFLALNLDLALDQDAKSKSKSKIASKSRITGPDSLKPSRFVLSARLTRSCLFVAFCENPSTAWGAKNRPLKQPGVRFLCFCRDALTDWLRAKSGTSQLSVSARPRRKAAFLCQLHGKARCWSNGFDGCFTFSSDRRPQSRRFFERTRGLNGCATHQPTQRRPDRVRSRRISLHRDGRRRRLARCGQ